MLINHFRYECEWEFSVMCFLIIIRKEQNRKEWVQLMRGWKRGRSGRGRANRTAMVYNMLMLFCCLLAKGNDGFATESEAFFDDRIFENACHATAIEGSFANQDGASRHAFTANSECTETAPSRDLRLFGFAGVAFTDDGEERTRRQAFQ